MRQTCPPEIGEEPPRNQEVAHRRRGCQPHGESTRQVGTAYHVFTPWESVQKPSAKTTVLFFFWGKIYKFSKRFQKTTKKRIGKVCLKWTGYHL